MLNRMRLPKPICQYQEPTRFRAGHNVGVAAVVQHGHIGDAEPQRRGTIIGSQFARK